jgi:hypothetical protein
LVFVLARLCAAAAFAALAAVAATACGGGAGDEPPTVGAEATSPAASGNDALLVAFAPNPEQPGVEPDSIRIANLATGDKHDLGPAAFYSHLEFSPDGRLLAVAEVDGDERVVTLYEVEAAQPVADGTRIDGLAGMQWSPNGAYLAVVTEEAIEFISRSGERLTVEGAGAPPGANALRWAWSADGAMFAVITEDGLALLPLDAEGGVDLPRADFPDPDATWVVRTGEGAREIGLVDLAPVAGLPEARAEYPVTISAGQIVGGEPRLVSIYDWGTLPSPEFDVATARQFPAIRKTCDPCRTADGSSSVLVFWVAQDQPTPGPDETDWPEGTGTFLALEATVESAIAVDLGIAPTGAIDVARWRPIYDVVRTGR